MKKVCFLVIFTTASFCALAQLTTNEQPYGLKERDTMRRQQQSFIVLSPPDLVRIAVEDSIREQSCIIVEDSIKGQSRSETKDSTSHVQGGGMRFAYPVWVDYTLENSGVWQELENGDKVWRLKVHIPGALSLHTYYDRFWLPDGCKFFVYNEETEQSIGAVTSGFINSSKANPVKYATALIYGEDIVFEYYQPAYVRDTAIISIHRIDYGYRYVNSPYQNGGRGGSLPCNKDICSTTNYLNERRAVTRILVPSLSEGSEWYSGSLINNTSNDMTPYVLTTVMPLCSGLDAMGNADAGDWIFYWDYTSDYMSSNPKPISTIGATIVANGVSSNQPYPNTFEVDFVLLLLKDDPRCLENFIPYYLGWDRSGNDESSATCLHHPKGDVQKYTLFNNIQNGIYPGTLWWGYGYYPIGGWWWYLLFYPGSLYSSVINDPNTDGILEAGGSFGAPLLNSNNKIIGTAAFYPSVYYSCYTSNFSLFNFAKLSYAWTGNGATVPERRLKDWLDPNNTGATTCNGINGTSTTVYTNYSSPIGNNPPIQSPITIKGTFVVNSQSTVTFKNTTVYCMPDAQIIVNPGGKLILNNATLKPYNDCSNQMWQGITVLGNDNLSQTDANQGVVELNNARIENAVCGIHVGSKTPRRLLHILPWAERMIYYSGGIVKADNANFVNNQQAVYFAPYENGTFNNVSYFENCEFRLDNPTPFSQAGLAQVKLHGVRGIPFTNCNFADNRTKNAASDYITGIYANNSSIKVNGNCSFFGFDKAIYITDAINPSQIYKSNFDNNHIAIAAEAVEDFRIGNCQFEIPLLNYFPENIGVYLKKTSLYSVENNIFTGETANRTLGVVTENTGEMNHFVKSNTFENLCTGCLAIGTNRNNKDVSQGLMYQCNKFENNDKDIYITLGSQISNIQSGYKSLWATGNVFYNSIYNIYNEGEYFTYWSRYQLNYPEHYPFNIYIGNFPHSMIWRKETGDHCCKSHGYAGDYYYMVECAPLSDLNLLNNGYITAKDIYDSKLTGPRGNGIGGGNDSTDLPINWDDPVVISIVEQLEMHSDEEFTITIGGRIPETDLEKKIVLYYELSNLKQYMDIACYSALEILANDTDGLDIQQYTLWVSRFNTVESDYLLADIYMNLENFIQAENILNLMPSRFRELDTIVLQHY